mgnify:CR=1 FL=1
MLVSDSSLHHILAGSSMGAGGAGRGLGFMALRYGSAGRMKPCVMRWSASGCSMHDGGPLVLPMHALAL